MLPETLTLVAFGGNGGIGVGEAHVPAYSGNEAVVQSIAANQRFVFIREALVMMATQTPDSFPGNVGWQYRQGKNDAAARACAAIPQKKKPASEEAGFCNACDRIDYSTENFCRETGSGFGRTVDAAPQTGGFASGMLGSVETMSR